ncbi:MAG: hypothetical protein ACLP29_16415 [Dissulfurispiraceae bacterium]
MAHFRGNWGEALGNEDWKANDAAIHNGGRILSAYWIDPRDRSKGKFWIITEAVSEAEEDKGTGNSIGSRAATTALLPEEY